MIWLTWRQFRVQFLVIATVVVAAGVALATTGPGLLDQYHKLAENFLQSLALDHGMTTLYRVGAVLMYALPPVIGAFWGAPLVARELETGTHRLVWTQSISRWHWLAVKVGFTGLAAVGVTGLLSWAVTWWSAPIDRAVNAGQDSNYFLPRMFPASFSAHALVPVGYAAFAFALGVAVGLAVRRTVVALAVTLTAVILVMALTPSFVRPHLMAPTDKLVTITEDGIRGFMLSGDGPTPQIAGIEVAMGAVGGWKVYDHTVDKAGNVVDTLPSWAIDCAPGPPPVKQGEGTERTDPAARAACFQRLADEGYRQHLKFFTADKFWPLQWREFGLFFGLAVLLMGFSFWRIRRDLS
ncbi:ABC transporter permease [Kribbella sp. NPDC026611]|uniref:ABC transporter permease n=1 Tax=Kribbella sp. NPDC026611 TaxID=3154911 RepID=UPI0033E83016